MGAGETTPDETLSADEARDVVCSPASAPAPPGAPPDLGPGDHVGRYQLRVLIGSGGMGAVFAAEDPELGRDVALKLIGPSARSGPRARARMLREARSLARLRHPNVVTIHDAGQQDLQIFIAMELIEGTTLSGWLREARRGWREILDRFVAAGRGLAAAHAAGMVHRDFKPDNVIVGGDRVVVVDFGLARDLGDDAGELDPDAGSAAGRRPAPEPSLTATGERLGTPIYMAPEQRAGAAVTARADQYSFCVAAWGALHGVMPAAGEAAVVGRPEVPRWVNAALARGLAADPDARWPSMAALLATLSRDRRVTRRRILLGAGAILLAGAALASALASRPADPCAGAAAEVTSIWDDAARARVSAAFAATGLSYAADTFARVDASLRGQLTALAAAHRDACAATEVRHEQSAEVLDLRMACLRRVRADAASLVTLLAEAGAGAVDRAVAAAAGVADPSSCADAAALLEVAPPPRDPAVAREAEAVVGEAGRIWDLTRLGRLQDALPAARALVPRARAVGHAPALTRALRIAAGAEETAGDPTKAIDLAFEALHAAEEARDDESRAQAAIVLVFSLGYKQRRFAEAEAMARVADAAIARGGDDPHLRVELDHALGSVLEAQSRDAAALAIYVSELGWAMRETAGPSRSMAKALDDLRDAQVHLGDFRGSLRTSQRSVRMAEALEGPDHPHVAVALSGLGVAAINLGDLDEADRAFSRALAIVDRSYGPDSESSGIYAQDLAETRLMQRRLDEADGLVGRAARIFEARDPRSSRFISCLDLRALVALRRGRPDEALALISRALALRVEVEGADAVMTGMTSGNLGLIQRRRGRLAEARAAVERELTIFQKTLGPSHGHTASAACQLAGILVAQGRAAAGVTLCEPALPILEKEFGRTSPNLIEGETTYAEGLLALGERGRALSLAERFDADAVAGRVDPELRATARFAHARALPEADRRRACVLAAEARTLVAGLPDAEALPSMNRWLQKHRCGG